MSPLLPGATIGVLGGGQLGRMLIYEALRMDYRVHIVDPDPQCPSARLAHHYVQAPLSDIDAAVQMAEQCDVVTLETEHVAIPVLEAVEKVATLRPGAAVLRHINDRLAQRRFLEQNDLPQPRFAPVDSLETLKEAVEKVGLPAILKSRSGGYDGKGQVRIKAGDDLAAAWERLAVPSVLEAFVPFDKEVSVVLARGADGKTATWPLAENVHRNGVLHTTSVPADVSPELGLEAYRIALRTLEALGHVGVAAVEMFVVDGRLLINEIAPRTHNSGHYTFGAATTSQFEQHLRAITGLPLADTRLERPVAMVNLLGDLWKNGPDWQTVLGPEVRLHLYGKVEARPGRKMGHLLVFADDAVSALERGETIHRRLKEASA